MRIDSLGCTWWVLSSKWSKSSQLAVATEPLVPLIRLGLYVLGRCSTWGCLFSRRRIFSVALPPQDAPRHRRRPTTASRHQRRTYTRFAPSAADLVRRFLSAADLVAQTEQHGQRPLAATTSTARGHELAGADSHMACAPTTMGVDPQVVDGIPPELTQNTTCGRERERRISSARKRSKSAETKDEICLFTSARRDAGTARLTGHVFVSIDHSIHPNVRVPTETRSPPTRPPPPARWPQRPPSPQQPP